MAAPPPPPYAQPGQWGFIPPYQAPPPGWGYQAPPPAAAPPPPTPAAEPAPAPLFIPKSFDSAGPVVAENVRGWDNGRVGAWIRSTLGQEYEAGTQYNTFCDFNGANLLNLGRQENRDMFVVHQFSKKTHPGLLLEGITSLMAQQAQYDKEQDEKRKEEEKKKAEEQKLLEIEKKKLAAKELADTPVRELVAQLAAFQRENPAEADWRKNNWRMEYWKPMHVYDWLKNNKEKQIVKFADAIGRQKMDGQKLVLFVQNDEAAAKDATMLEYGEEFAIKGFCKAVKTAKGVIDLNQKKEKDDGIPIIQSAEIQTQKFLCKGGFGAIYKGKYQNMEVAQKKISKSNNPQTAPEAIQQVVDQKMAQDQQKPEQKEKRKTVVARPNPGDTENEWVKDIEREARMTHLCRGPNVVPLVGVNKDKEPFIVTEFMPCGTLADEYQKSRRGDPTSIFHRNNPQNSDIENKPRPPLIQRVRIVSRVAFAIASFHSLPKPIVHLDIAARNVLLDKKKQPKICDFGLAAFQEDMVEIHRERAELLQSDSWDQVLVKEDSIIQEKTTDPRKLALYQHVHKHTDEKICMRWRPPSACGPNPLFDWKMDVYGFGCLMYEVATETVPHSDVMDEKEVRAQKSVEGAPQCDLSPTNVDIEYDAIMMRCLSPDPPKMIEIADDLDRLYMKLRRGNYADHETDVQKLFQGVQSARTADPSQRNRAVKPNAENMVTFSFPPHIRFEAKHSDLQTRWETCGETQEVLQEDIKITLHSWDYDSITKLLQCIKVENRKPNVVVLVDCLEALGKLAEQADGPSDEQWESVARAVLMLLEAVDKSEDKIDDEHYRAIATSGLYAFSRLGENRADAPVIALLNPNSMPNSVRDDTPNASHQMPLHTMALNIVSNIIRRDIFGNDPNLQERICDAIRALSSSAMGTYSKLAAREAMYLKGLVVALLEILCQQQRLGNVNVITTAIEALLCFQTDQLLAPNPPTLLSANFHFQQRARSGGAAAIQESSTHPSVFSILFAFLKNFAGNWTDGKQEQLPALEPTLVPVHISLLETVAKALVDICQNSEPEQVPKLVAEMDRQSIRHLLTLIQMFKESFAIQEGVVGLLRFAVVAEAEENKADKIGVINEFDPSFSLFVQAMNMFPRDKNLVQTVNPVTSSFKPSFNTNIASSVSRVPMSMASRSPMFVGDMFQAMLGDFKSWLNELRQDDIDRQHSAARLQLSAAIVLGTACSVHDKAQQALTSSHCCLHIVTALRTFRTDVSLVTYGCAALSHICRKNTAHQNVLSQFGILAVLLECLNMHATEWSVMEGILMVLVALLEPSPQILQKLEGPAAAPTQKLVESDEEEEIEDFSGSSVQKANKLREAEAEAKRKLKAKRDAERKAQVSAQLALWLLDSKLWRRLVDECMYRSTLPWCAGLAASFLKLVGAFLYWIPQKLEDWSGAFEEWSDEMRTVDVVRKYLFAQFNLSKATEIRRAIRDTSSERPNLQVYVLSALEMWHRLPKEATSFAAKQDQRAVAPVHAAGLAVLIVLIMKKTPETYRNLGDELTLDIDADELEALMSLAITGFHAAISLPHQPAPILLKYSLWLMILMLSDPRWARMHGAEMSVAACLLTQGVTPALLIELLQTYRYFRSLQSLCIILLTKLYDIGHLVAVADEVSRLRQLIVSTSALAEFTPDEGHDTVTMGYFKYNRLPEQCMALKKALDKFEAGTQEVEKKEEPVWDGKNRPHHIEVTAALAEGDEVKFHIKVYWNTKKSFWPLRRSYAEFAKLNKYFFEKFGLKFTFPADSLFSLKDAALEARRLSLQDFVSELVRLPYVCHNERFMKFFLVTEQKELKFCCTPPPLRSFLCPGFDGWGTDVVVADEKRLVFCSFAKPRSAFQKVHVDGAVAVFRSNQIVFSMQLNVGVFKLAWDPRRQSLALLLAGGLIQFYTLNGESLKEEQKVKLLASPATSFAHSLESPFLFAASTDSKVLVFDTAACTPSASSHTNKVVTLTTAFEEKEQLLFLGTNTGELKVCCLKNDQALASPLCNLKLRTTGQLTALCYVAEIEMLFVVIEDELICMSLTETEVADPENRSVKSKIMRSKDQPQSLVKVTYSLKNFGFGLKQHAASIVFMMTMAPFPAYFLAMASSNGIVDLFQLPRTLDYPPASTSPKKVKGYREFDLIASWKFKPNSIGKLSYAPSAQTLYACAEDKVFAISLAAYMHSLGGRNAMSTADTTAFSPQEGETDDEETAQ